MKPTLEIDLVAEAAYVRLADGPVEVTEEVTDYVLVDLNAFGVVVGVEVLDLHAAIPTDDLVDRFHVHSSGVEALMSLKSSVSSVLFTHGTDGSIQLTSRTAATPQPA